MPNDKNETWQVRTEGGKKSRSFRCMGLGLLAPDTGYSNPTNPLWATFACEDGVLRPLLANLMTGRTVDRTPGSRTIIFPKSAGYETNIQSLGNGTSLVSRYLPGMFKMDPGPIDLETDIEFVVLPDSGWDARCGIQDEERRAAAEFVLGTHFPKGAPGWLLELAGKEEVEPPTAHRGSPRVTIDPATPRVDHVGALAALVPLATLMAAYLDRRTRCPLYPDTAFHLLLLVELVGHRLAGFPARRGDGVYRASMEWWVDEGIGYAEPMMVNTTHAKMEDALAAASARFTKAHKRRVAPVQKERVSRTAMR